MTDNHGCWLHITSGRGPAECCWVVARLTEEITRQCQRAGIAVEVVEAEPGPEPGTFKSALLSLPGATGPAEQWIGTVQWIGKSPYRLNHKRKNWYVGVERLQIPEKPQWSENELRVETMRSSGPGGQHVNKVESAVRVTHPPTGLTATAGEERSQLLNRKLALARLAALFDREEQKKAGEASRDRWQQHNELERGNPVMVYKGKKFKAV